MSRRLLVVRLDSMGDVLVCGPAIRVVAAAADSLTLLTGPLGEAAGRLLPGVDEVLVWNCPWIANPPPAVSPDEVAALVDRLAARQLDEAVILTSFHQSPLPTALLLRLAGVPRIVAASEDYPGSLLDLRLPVAGDGPEPERMLATVRAAGFELPPGDPGTLAVRLPAASPDQTPDEPESPYLVVHPGTTAAARAYPAERWAETVRLLVAGGWRVLVTGSAGERELTSGIVAAARAGVADDAGGAVLDLAGALDLAGLARLLAGAEAVLVANTGPAHLAAAVGTPVVSLFSPVVPASRWAPYGVPVVLLGDQHAPCRGTRRTECPVPGHPCLTGVAPASVVRAVEQLAGRPAAVAVSR
ncbi:glycosyltransferase family 9 protein [Jatrophihabitans sp.]|uniref:glycosyltransferase family 9 protein n=1 Tax=Jatrophihabitans sp. TaxID=1932789 RepID=UPI002BF7B47B|nr:glycosyltransferase family 9 protein [Jatrophihabitans sp.]